MLFCEHQLIFQADSSWENRHLIPSCLQAHAQHRSLPVAQVPGSHLHPVTAQFAICPALPATYGASYHHHSLCCRRLAACGCCPHLLCDLCLGKRKCGLQNIGGPRLAHWEERREETSAGSSGTGQQHPSASYETMHRQTQTSHFPARMSQVLGSSHL